MGLETLDQFIQRTEDRNGNAYIHEEGFKELYVRRATRWIDGRMTHGFLDIARVKAAIPGKGAFTRLVKKLLSKGIPVYVERVGTQRFARGLLALGFTQSPTDESSFYQMPKPGIVRKKAESQKVFDKATPKFRLGQHVSWSSSGSTREGVVRGFVPGGVSALNTLKELKLKPKKPSHFKGTDVADQDRYIVVVTTSNGTANYYTPHVRVADGTSKAAFALKEASAAA